MIKYLQILSAISIILLSSCNSLPTITKYESTKITTGFGPEDIVIDSISSIEDRLLVSCASRRESDDKMRNGIYTINLQDESVYEMKRVNEPDSLFFNPHGIDVAFIDGVAYLYVINHQDEIGDQSILIYQIFANKIIYDSAIRHSLINSPNDIFVNNDGSFFFTNDAGERGNRMEIILSQKKSSLVYFPTNNSPIVIDNELGYANGVYFDGEYLFVSTVSEQSLYRYKKINKGFIEKTLIADGLKGGDNLNPYQGGLLVPTHPKFFKFFRHAKKSKCHSPSVVYHYHPDFTAPKVIYCDYGDHINTVSTALVYKNKLYLAQIFDDFILSVDLKSNLK